MSVKIELLIGGVDYSPYIDLETLSVDNNIIMSSDSAQFTMQLDGELPRPKAGQEFIWHAIDSVTKAELSRDFGGVIVSINETTEGASLIYSVTAKSYDHWFNRHLVTAWYNQDTASNIIKTMISQYCLGFTTNNVQNTTAQVIPQYFNYQKPTECMRLIADQLEYGWYIDYYKDVHFFPLEFFISPLPKNYLDVDNDMVSYGDLTITEDGEQVFNKVILKGFKVRSNSYMNLTFLGDASTTQWSLGYRVSSVKGDIAVAVYPSMAAYQADTQFQTTGVPSSGTLMKLAKDVIEGAPDQASASGTAYIHYTQHLLRIPNALGSGTLPSGYVVAAHFYYLKDQVFMGQDVGAQNQIAKLEGTDGVYEYSQEDKSLTNSTIGAPQAKAELLIRKYSLPQFKGSFVSFINGWRAGQYFTLVTQNRMGGLNKVMYVQRVTKSLISNINGNYITQNTVEFADSPYLV